MNNEAIIAAANHIAAAAPIQYAARPKVSFTQQASGLIGYRIKRGGVQRERQRSARRTVPHPGNFY